MGTNLNLWVEPNYKKREENEPDWIDFKPKLSELVSKIIISRVYINYEGMICGRSSEYFLILKKEIYPKDLPEANRDWSSQTRVFYGYKINKEPLKTLIKTMDNHFSRLDYLRVKHNTLREIEKAIKDLEPTLFVKENNLDIPEGSYSFC